MAVMHSLYAFGIDAFQKLYCTVQYIMEGLITTPESPQCRRGAKEQAA